MAVCVVLSLAACKTKGSSDSPPSPAAVAPTPTPSAVAVASAAPAADVTPTASAVAAASAAPAPGEWRYAVTGVAANDVLNVREKPDVASKKVYSFGPTVKGIRSTGQHQEKGGTPWIEVAFEGGTGWVNRTFLSEQHPGGGCNDPEVAALIRAFMKAVTASDGAAFKATISPLTSLSITPETRPVKIPFAQLDAVFSSKTVLNVGQGDGGGPDITGTFKDLVVPTLRDSILKKGAQEKCGKVLTGSNNRPAPESFPGAAFVSFYYPGQETNGFGDWVSWIGSIDYVDGKPYIFSLSRFQRGI